MTQPFDDEYGERLRRALHAEAEAVTPSPEGLERIRSKINHRHERRLGLSYTAPWLRPFTAVAAALAVCLAAVSVTPALATFVQTGRFSPDSGSDGGKSTTNESHRSGNQVPPNEPAAPRPSASASPTAIRSSNTGKHVVKGDNCPPGEQTVTPAGTAAPRVRARVKITCQAPPDGSTSSPPVTEGPPTPPVTTPSASPSSDQPTSDSVPSGNQSP